MKVTWLGQLSILIETKITTIMVDPYLTDHLYETVGPQFKRLVPINVKYRSMHPDMILLSHEHGDHLDIPSLKSLLDTNKKVHVLAGTNAWKKVRKDVGGDHNYVQLMPGTEWSFKDVHVRAIKAYHSDDTAIGFLIHGEGKTIYITGDTLYNSTLAYEVHEHVNCMFVVINGLGNNMNCVDAARLAEVIEPEISVPVHWGMFEKFSDNPEWFVKEARNRNQKVRILKPYEEMDLDSI